MELLKSRKEEAIELSNEIFVILKGLMRAFPMQKDRIEWIGIFVSNLEKNDFPQLIKHTAASSKKHINELLESLAEDAARDELPYGETMDLLGHFYYALEQGMPFFDENKSLAMRNQAKNIINICYKKVELREANEKWKGICLRLDKLA